MIEAVVFSDYNKGYLTESLCKRVIQLCNEHQVCTIVDPKANYAKYMHCTIIKPNRNELKHIFGIDIKTVPLIDAHRTLHTLINCSASIITLAEKGISAYINDQHYVYQEDVKEVIDVTGAGDIVCSVLATHHNADMKTILRYASYYASISISHIGAYVITPADIQKLYTVSIAKQITTENKIVFTNGCFDILHSAHIQLFEFCRSLGSTVIVGLNTDASIKRLKGPSRPINSLEDRMKLLQSISYIDVVIPFDEDTPIKLIEHIKPHYLVKGGDYTKENVIGGDLVDEVILFNYIDGKSTTNLIKKCQGNI
jgi:D-beta-D-heptose 7-phosphate kinase/D-beta-D-heptose 1-phosphate adenosyltransferase